MTQAAGDIGSLPLGASLVDSLVVGETENIQPHDARGKGLWRSLPALIPTSPSVATNTMTTAMTW
jgi:hypothetical protein